MSQSNYIDDETVSDDELLLRKIPPSIFQNGKEIKFYRYDEEKGRLLPNSLAFQESSDGTGMSVFLESEIIKSERKAEDLIENSEGLVSITAGEVRELGLGVQRNPTKEEPAHANVIDLDRNRKKPERKRISKKLAELAQWVKKP